MWRIAVLPERIQHCFAERPLRCGLDADCRIVRALRARIPGRKECDCHLDSCEVVALPVTVSYDDKTTKDQKLPIALCGYNGVFKIPPAVSIDEIKKYSELMPVIVMPHMGAEYKAGPDSIRTTTYHAMIDAGADMVIGNHPHWVQSTEAYKGKLIVYSMGNFIFDQQARPEKTRSAMIDVQLAVENTKVVDQWAEVASSCKNNFAECQRLVTSKHLKKLEFTYKFDVHGSENSNKLVKPASESELQSIKQRLNWDTTMCALGQ